MFRFIQTSNTGVVQTFGKFTKTISPGLNFYFPYIQSISVVSNKLSQNTFGLEVRTKDNTFVNLSLAVQYKINTEDTEKAFFSLHNPKEQMNAYIENSVREFASKKTLDDIFESQNELSKCVMDNLHKKMQEYGFTIENTLVTSIEPNKEVKIAMNKIMATEKEKMARKNEADAYYIEQVRTAEADRDRKKLQGEGTSLQRKAIIEGYNESIDGMAQKFGLSSRDIINFVLKTQYFDTMETIGKSQNTKVLFMSENTKNHNENLIGLAEAVLNPDIKNQCLRDKIS